MPLSLAGTCAAMWAAGFSIDNLSLMALAVSIGFVVDDAIVMIENMFRFLERGASPLRASLKGAKQIGFTVVSISISLIAAFIPLLFMGGIVGRIFREFSVTLAFAIGVSTIVSLSVTPMICAYFVRAAPSPDATWLDRRVEGLLSRLTRFYGRTLDFVIGHRALALIAFVGTVALTVVLFIATPKGYFPQDDTGLVFGGTQASTDISFEAMEKLQQKAMDIVLADPTVAGLGSSVGGGLFGSSVNNGRLFISLKPLNERNNAPTAAVIGRLRAKLSNIPGLRVFLVPSQDLRVGGRQSNSQYQFTLWSPDIDQLQTWVPKVVDRVKDLPGVIDVTTDREQGGLQANIEIDRDMATRLGVRIQDIDNALNDAFSQRQISTIYSPRNQYRVVMEVDDKYQRDPTNLADLYVPGNGNSQVPLSAVARFTRGISPLVVNHQGQFPSTTITYNVAPNTPLETATAEIQQAVAGMHIPDTIHADFVGDAQAFQRTLSAQPLLLLAALVAVYIVLGVLYESLAHPLTIISTLPSAGLGALLGAAGVPRRAYGDRLHWHHSAHRAGEEERHHDGGLRARGRTPAGLVAGAGDPRRLPRPFPSHHDDDARRHARRTAAGDRIGPRLGTPSPARHHHHWRPVGFAGADALHDARDLSAARPAAQPAGRGELPLAAASRARSRRGRRATGGIENNSRVCALLAMRPRALTRPASDRQSWRRRAKGGPPFRGPS